MNSKQDKKLNFFDQEISRRGIIKLGLMSAVSWLVPDTATAALRNSAAKERRLCLYNLHSKEYIDTVYWKKGRYVPESLKDINHMLRDHYNGAVKHIDKNLINLLFNLQQRIGSKEPFHILSGYRTAKTNALLRKNKKGAARKSLHMYGKAVDLRLPGTRLKSLRRSAYQFKAGGVGYYPGSNFVHLDVGRVRYW